VKEQLIRYRPGHDPKPDSRTDWDRLNRMSDEDLAEAIRLGVRKINVGSALKRVYFESLREACRAVDGRWNVKLYMAFSVNSRQRARR